MPLRWPAELPADTEWAMLVATYAKQTGRVVAYSMAAFRQAFAAGRDLGERDTVLIAAAAAEMHPAAVIKARRAARHARAARRRRPRRRARPACVDVPALRVGDARVPRRPRARAAAAAGGRVKANREYELIVRRGGRGPAALADPERVDQVEIVEIATGEVALFWDTAPAQTGRLSRALKADLAQLEAEEFMRRWRRWEAALKEPAGAAEWRGWRDSSPPLATGGGAPLSSSPRRGRCACGAPAPHAGPAPPPRLRA